jgi:molybdopterin molybdotransferase
MKEETSEVEGCLIQFSSTPRPQENIRPRGDDIASEQMAVAAGTLLRPAEVSLLAAIGRSRIDVVPRPRVAVFTTGDEVVPVHGPLLPGQIYNSNQYLLNGLVADAGAKRVWTEHLPDDPEVTAARLEEASRWADAIVTCGGVSMGEHDHIRGAVERLGAVVFWRVSMKPGKPILFGLVAGRPIFGMPGNPVSAMVGFEIFVRPALLHMAGHSALQRPRVRARLLAPISHRPGRQEYVRTLTTIRNDEFVSEPYPGQGSHLIRSMTHANSLAIVPTGTGCLAVGDFVEVMMTQWPEW